MSHKQSRLKLTPLKSAMLAAAMGVSGSVSAAELWSNDDYLFQH